MRRLKKYGFYLLLLPLVIFSGAHAEGPVNLSYREKTVFQVGREIYVTGETIWYKVFAFSNLGKIYSKVLYVELVDSESQHVLGQILEVSEGMAAASVSIPDTLETGTYFLKAYTNWMRNFNSSQFATFPIYIYNQYDESEKAGGKGYSILQKPSIYIENGRLIHQANTRIKIDFAGWMSDKAPGFLIETTSGARRKKFLLNAEGEGYFNFSPQTGKQYRIDLEPTKGRLISFELPAVEKAMPVINIIGVEEEELRVLPVNMPVRTANYQIELRNGNKLIWKKSITGSNSDTFNIGFDPTGHGLYSIRLLDLGKNILTEKQVYLNRKNEIVSWQTNSIEPRTSVELPISQILYEGFEKFNMSVSIYKSVPGKIQKDKGISLFHFNQYYSSVSTGNRFHVLLPQYQEAGDDNITSFDKTEVKIKFPVEDIGVLYSGKVVNSINNGALSGMEVVLSKKDTIPQLLFSKTDEHGRFFFLIDEYGENHAMINLYLLGTQLSGSFMINLDNKFHFQESPELISETILNKKEEITNYLDEESKRVMIQRAFGRNKTDSDPAVNSNSKKPFYEDDVIIIFPSIYFDLPNFEEIAREILPRVRYKYVPADCEVSIFHKDHGIKTSSPLVLFDGLPVKDNCKLYSLKSGDINRIEILSGGHVSGNLYYAGILAIYTSSEFRAQNAHKNERFFYDVSGYALGSTFQIPDYNDPNEDLGKKADFKNQLFWDPEVDFSETNESVHFYTSDEEGFYTLDICGYTSNGQLFQIKRMINVKSEQ